MCLFAEESLLYIQHLMCVCVCVFFINKNFIKKKRKKTRYLFGDDPARQRQRVSPIFTQYKYRKRFNVVAAAALKSYIPPLYSSMLTAAVVATYFITYSHKMVAQWWSKKRNIYIYMNYYIYLFPYILESHFYPLCLFFFLYIYINNFVLVYVCVCVRLLSEIENENVGNNIHKMKQSPESQTLSLS